MHIFITVYQLKKKNSSTLMKSTYEKGELKSDYDFFLHFSTFKTSIEWEPYHILYRKL